MMREISKCIAWALGMGAVALLAAACSGNGPAQMDGVSAWLVFLVYAPCYLLGQVFVPEFSAQTPGTSFMAQAVAAQFLYFFLVAAALRLWLRKRRRRS